MTKSCSSLGEGRKVDAEVLRTKKIIIWNCGAASHNLSSKKTSRDLQHIALCFQPPCKKKNSGTRLTGGTGDLLERSIFGGEKTNKSLRQSQEPGWWRCCSLWHHKGQTSTLGGGKGSRQKMQWMKFSFVHAECADQVHVWSFVLKSTLNEFCTTWDRELQPDRWTYLAGAYPAWTNM